MAFGIICFISAGVNIFHEDELCASKFGIFSINLCSGGVSGALADILGPMEEASCSRCMFAESMQLVYLICAGGRPFHGCVNGVYDVTLQQSMLFS